MSERIVVHARNAVYLEIEASESVNQEISDTFSFEVPGAKWIPAVRNRRWDGRVRLYKRGLLFVGLLEGLKSFALERNYELVLGERVELPTNGLQNRCSTTELTQQFVTSLNIPEQFAPRSYQTEALQTAIEKQRGIFLAATGSGKTMIITMLARYYAKSEKVLVVVPTTALVYQGLEDFKKYGYANNVQGIVGGEDREVVEQICITTWQSAIRESKEWFEQFGTVIIDEAHGAKAASLQKILSLATNAYHRFGFTATMSGAKSHEMLLTAMIGPVYSVANTKELMDAGLLARANIKMLILKHPDAACKTISRKYQEEIEFIVACESRNRLIANLALDLKGNTLVLFTRVGKHGYILYDAIRKKAGSRGVHFLHGDVAGEDRNQVRKIIEGAQNDIIVASFGVFSQGVDVPRIHNIVCASPYKARIPVLQSTGRALRLAHDKTECKIFDIVDDLSWKRRRNYVLRHAEARLRIYLEAGFDVSSVHLNLVYDFLNIQKDTGGNQSCLWPTLDSNLEKNS